MSDVWDSPCPVPVWDGPYRMKCALGKGKCAYHGTVIHTEDGSCDPMYDGFCRTHALYTRHRPT